MTLRMIVNLNVINVWKVPSMWYRYFIVVAVIMLMFLVVMNCRFLEVMGSKEKKKAKV